MKLMKLKTSLTYRYSFLRGQNFSRPVAKNINKIEPSHSTKKSFSSWSAGTTLTEQISLERARIAQGKNINIFNPLHNIIK